MTSRPILPGATVGVLGSGQLGRMFAIAARRMGYRVHTFSPDTDTPTGQVADLEIVAPYEDLDAVRRFAHQVRVVTFEFENVPAATAAAAAESTLVRPRGEVLHITQNRLREKRFLEANGFPVAPFRGVRSEEDLSAAIAEIGPKGILKTAGFGYDGKGQIKIHAASAAAEAWRRMDGKECVLEAWIKFEKEVSVIAARGVDGNIVDYGVVENDHKNHILDLTIAPGRVTGNQALRAKEIARAVMEKLDVIGVLCVEFFVARDGELLINELAPRPHNSGHFSFDACVTSQFEQQLRASCGLPLGSTELLRPAAMANLMGDLWDRGEPNWAEALAMPGVKLHLYGKTSARPGRKMGHLTAMGSTAEEAAATALAAREALVDRLGS
ncbi:MAG: 5-(carboxyamino)imidazole ribonucleotide synthase [Acidobacteria bacterium]|nr:5-(carboxyamino)imidazole ribonucleotide synthase [Acidobacteriota bacterium]